MRNLFTFAVLMALWVVLSGQFDAFHLGLGVFSCVLVTWMASQYFYGEDESRPILAYVALAVRFVPYAFWLVKEIFLANVHVLRLALVPGAMREVVPTVLSFKTRLETPAARYLLANSITLTPGTVTLKLEGDILYVHSISKTTTVGLEGEMEARIGAVFGEPIHKAPRIREILL